MIFVVVLGLGGLVFFCAMFWRDRSLEAKESGALWLVAPFKDLDPDTGDIFLILPSYGERPGRFVVKKDGQDLVGAVDLGLRGHGSVVWKGAECEVWMPNGDGQPEGELRTVEDSTVFWRDGLVEGEILPLSTRVGKRMGLVTAGREYEVTIPPGSERELGRVEIDEVTVAEFARADKLSFGRARLLAVRKGQPDETLPFFLWLALRRG